jgi:hypothetical protein
MKKLWLVLLALLVIGIGTAGAQVWTVSAPANYKLKKKKNDYGQGYQGIVQKNYSFNGKKAAAGEQYELEITFTSNKDISGLQVCIIDGSEKANYWAELSEWGQFDAIKANVETTQKFTFTTKAAATSSDAKANQLVFDTKTGTAAATLTFSKFIFTRVK